MAQTISTLVQAAVSALDDAYALNPSGDIEQMKADAMSAFLPADTDKNEWLTLASFDPDILVIENTQVYAEIYANGLAMFQQALDDEAILLQNP